MITCKKATELISKQHDQPLTIKELLSLKLHLFICEFCEKFRQHLDLMRTHLAAKKESDDNQIKVPEGAKKRLKKILEEKQEK